MDSSSVRIIKYNYLLIDQSIVNAYACIYIYIYIYIHIVNVNAPQSGHKFSVYICDHNCQGNTFVGIIKNAFLVSFM